MASKIQKRNEQQYNVEIARYSIDHFKIHTVKAIFRLFSLLLIANAANAQDHKFQVGVNATPEFSHRVLSGNSDAIQSIFRPKLGYAFGASFAYNFTNNLGLEVGLQYTNKGYKTDKLVFSQHLGFPWGNGNDYAVFYYSHNYLAVPLKLNVLLGKQKVRFLGSVGIETWILLNATNRQVEYKDNKQVSSTSESMNNINPVNISPILSVGIDWKLTDFLNLRVEPTFRYGLLNVTNNSTEKLISAGLNIGLYYGF